VGAPGEGRDGGDQSEEGCAGHAGRAGWRTGGARSGEHLLYCPCRNGPVQTIITETPASPSRPAPCVRAPSRPTQEPVSALAAPTRDRLPMQPTLPILLAALTLPAQAEKKPGPEAVEFFEKHVRPVLAEKCASCHGPKAQRGGLRLDGRAALLK